MVEIFLGILAFLGAQRLGDMIAGRHEAEIDRALDAEITSDVEQTIYMHPSRDGTRLYVDQGSCSSYVGARAAWVKDGEVIKRGYLRVGVDASSAGQVYQED